MLYLVPCETSKKIEDIVVIGNSLIEEFNIN